MRKVKKLSDVPSGHLCCGCGICAYLYPDQIRMVDVPSTGRRPVFTGKDGEQEVFAEALEVCPGISLSHSADTLSQKGLVGSLLKSWGPVLELWEGYAGDPEIRFTGSSGGVMSALALYCLEQEPVQGILHVSADETKPFLNRTILSKTRESIVAAAGSRYSPASPCENLGLIHNSGGPCVFMGKPCDVAAVRKLEEKRPHCSGLTALSIGCFCAGTPSTGGTLEMLDRMGVEEPDTVTLLRYRGHGWPGKTRVETTDSGATGKCVSELDYSVSWGDILQKHRQWRCYICPDHTAEFADISVGDPWYRETEKESSGRSLILVRTRRGQDALRKAIAHGYLLAEKVQPGVLPASQFNLEKARARIWGQMAALRLLHVPCPEYRGFHLLYSWWHTLGWNEKMRSFLGTVKRVFVKDLRKKNEIPPYT